MTNTKSHNYLTGQARTDPYRGGVCPRCNSPLPEGYPGAISHWDNKTELCSACGEQEVSENLHPERVH